MAKERKSPGRYVKTNAMRILETAGVPFSVAAYPVDESDLSGTHVAEVLGQPQEQVFKTLVLIATEGGGASQGRGLDHIVCCIPVAEELDFKKVAVVSGEKEAKMLPLKDLTKITGYVRGGCSPLGMKKQFPTYIDETALLFDHIAISAGMRDEQIIVNAEDLARITEATFADLTRE